MESNAGTEGNLIDQQSWMLTLVYYDLILLGHCIWTSRMPLYTENVVHLSDVWTGTSWSYAGKSRRLDGTRRTRRY
jgi:hypothetical protein